MTAIIGVLRPERHACGEVHLPNCYNPHSDDTYCVCGKVRWPGRVGTWHSRKRADGWDTYFLHADHCPDRVMPDEYAIEADPGKLTASFPTFQSWDGVEAAAQSLERMRPDLGRPRTLWRVTGGPWMDREALPDPSHLCGVEASGYAPHDDALFDGFEPPAGDYPAEELSADRRRTIRQADDIKAGRHPLGGLLHPEADRSAHRGDGKSMPLRCGSCIHRVDRGWPKCDLSTMSHSAASDVRAWWPACTRYEAKETADA